jgi:hypothetical protein
MSSKINLEKRKIRDCRIQAERLKLYILFVFGKNVVSS